MIFHPRFARLCRFADGELAGGERRRVVEHLAACTRCRRAVSAVRSLARAAGELPDPRPPNGYPDRIRPRGSGADFSIVPTADPSVLKRDRRSAWEWGWAWSVAALLCSIGAGLAITRPWVADGPHSATARTQAGTEPPPDREVARSWRFAFVPEPVHVSWVEGTAWSPRFSTRSVPQIPAESGAAEMERAALAAELEGRFRQAVRAAYSRVRPPSEVVSDPAWDRWARRHTGTTSPGS